MEKLNRTSPAMNAQGSSYDSELQMFIDPPRELDLAHLRFWRWLGEHGRLEGQTAGDPAGVYAADVPLDRQDAQC